MVGFNENPFGSGESRVIRPPSTVLVIFGATGDLAHRKLLPALYNLAVDDFLPGHFRVVGVSRSGRSDEDFRKQVKESVAKYSRRDLDPVVWKAFEERLFYHEVDAHNPEDFSKLSERLKKLSTQDRERMNLVYYLAVGPQLFAPICENLSAANLIAPVDAVDRSSLIIVEKPFGHDLASARALNIRLQKSVDERQIFRIDHYLGKETVQNILVFRFANGIFEPVWNRQFVDHIQFSVCETIGVEDRAAYFDSAGILRDIIQNHLLQMLALLCIEPPLSLSDAESIRNEKVKVLRSLRPIQESEVHSRCVRARYGPGFINGKPVPGYLEEEGVAQGSTTDTYAALLLEIDNWRWRGVPIYVRAGKRLPKRTTEINVFFKPVPTSLFRGRQVQEMEQNVLTIQVQPREGISLHINSKPPGPRLRARPVEMDFRYHESFSTVSSDAYERLLLDAMKGDATLFTRSDEIEGSWDFLAPVLDAWGDDRRGDITEYESGSWGPEEADGLLAKRGHRWREL